MRAPLPWRASLTKPMEAEEDMGSGKVRAAPWGEGRREEWPESEPEGPWVDVTQTTTGCSQFCSHAPKLITDHYSLPLCRLP